MNILQTIDQVGGLVLERHLQLQSGKHASGYINVDPLFPYVVTCYAVAGELGTPFADDDVDVVVSAATGGVVWATFTALHMSNNSGRFVKAAWVEKDDEGNLVFDRVSFAETVKGKRVLVVDDVMSNANERGTVYRICRVVEACGGVIVGASILVNRCGGTAEQLGVPRLEQLDSVSFDAWEQRDCPLCPDHVPMITNVGHGKKFQAEHPDYPGGFEEYVPESP